jgi:hypothetical protein
LYFAVLPYNPLFLKAQFRPESVFFYFNSMIVRLHCDYVGKAGILKAFLERVKSKEMEVQTGACL